jgi:predicted MFS family arabinose efflux permease
MGACFAALWSTTEIWLNGVVDDRHRGRIIGAAGTVYAGAQFLGPLGLSMTGVTGVLPLIAAMLPLAAAVIVALCIRSTGSESDDTHAGASESLKLAFTLAGSLIAMSFLAGVLETSMQSLLPLYALAHGLTDQGASQMLALFSVGEAILVAALGFFADRYGRECALKLCIIPAIAVMIAMPASIFHISVLGPTLFLAGGAISGVYTLGVIQIGHEFHGQRLAIVSTGFAMAYAAGAVVGSTPVGLAIDVFGTAALPSMISAGFLALATLIFLRTVKAGDRFAWAAP